MKEIEILKGELVGIDKNISAKEISEEIYNLVSLLNKRVFINKKIQKLEWNNLTDKEREDKRFADFKITKLYFEKFKDEISNKYEYKKEYIHLLEQIKFISVDEMQSKIIYKVLVSVLNSAEYINICESVCIDIIMNELKVYLEVNHEVKKLILIYEKLLLIPFEI